MAILHIDLDDTTVDFLAGVCSYYNADKPFEEHVGIDKLTDWNTNGVFIKPYVNLEGLYLNLQIKPDAIDVLKRLSERHNVKFLTAFPTAQSAKEKVEFVEKHFPFIGVANTTLTWNKGDIKGDLLLDDSPIFLPSFEGIKVCFDNHHNQGLVCDHRVSSWLEFETVIEELEQQGVLKLSYKLVTEEHLVIKV